MIPYASEKKIKDLTISMCFLIFFINSYYLISLQNKLNSVESDYNEMSSSIVINFNDLETLAEKFYKELNNVMFKKGEDISISKISINLKYVLIQGNASSTDQINIFKTNLGDSYALKKVLRQEDKYAFELEKRYE
jgi:hypothetical protein